jgi:hypothetical protein
MRKDQNRLFGGRLIANADARVLFESRGIAEIAAAQFVRVSPKSADMPD